MTIGDNRLYLLINHLKLTVSKQMPDARGAPLIRRATAFDSYQTNSKANTVVSFFNQYSTQSNKCKIRRTLLSCHLVSYFFFALTT